MTEAQWLACTVPTKLVKSLLGRDAAGGIGLVRWLRKHPTESQGSGIRGSERKMRLLACAMCRRIEGLFVDTISGRAVEVSERFADGQASEEELARAFAEASVAAEEQAGGTAVFESAAPAFGVLPGGWRARAKAAAAAAASCARQRPETAISAAIDAAREEAAVVGRAQWAAETLGATASVALIRDIFGNPFRPAAINPAWLTPNVTALAATIYDDRAFDRLPILADALEEAGCDNAAILSHCRGPGPHVRGCWVVDLVTGRA
jgi:hypothetical protein